MNKEHKHYTKIQAFTEAVIVEIQVNRKSILFELVIYDIVKI